MIKTNLFFDFTDFQVRPWSLAQQRQRHAHYVLLFDEFLDLQRQQMFVGHRQRGEVADLPLARE
jgi:hypothetical protein